MATIAMLGIRTRVLSLAPTICLSIVLARVAYLQLGLGEYHRAQRERPVVRVREIPALRGTIRAADGTILAIDRCDADLAIHFRYLQQPPDSAWIERQARARLRRSERRLQPLLDRERAAIQSEIDVMWRSLAELTGTAETELRSRAATVELRVRRVAAAVEARRRTRDTALSAAAADRTASSSPALPSTAPAPSLWQLVWDRLHEPDRRPPPAAVTLPEQSRFYPIVENLSADQLVEFATHPERFPGVRLESVVRRHYPHGSTASTTIGYVEPAATLLRAGADDQPQTRLTGRAGVEGFYDTALNGRFGWVRERSRHRGSPPEILGGKPPQPGQDITLTIDLRLQAVSERLLRHAAIAPDGSDAPAIRLPSGAAIVMDARTGALLSAASAPNCDLNVASDPGSPQWQRLVEQSDRPLFNRVAQMALPPGSAFKPVTALAALDSQIPVSQSYFCQGFLHEPDQFRCLIYRHAGVGHEDVTLSTAIVRSCNVYFFHVAERIGWRPIVRMSEDLGLGRPTGVDLSNETAGFVPTPERLANRQQRDWQLGDSLGLAIGQGALTTSPLQIAVMMAAIANGGFRVTPHVRQGAFQPPRSIPGLDASSLREIRDALRRVVSDPNGTGHISLYLDELAIAGKTGTAQSGSTRGDHSWFAGYVPANDPQWVIVVVLEHGGGGGENAAPIARQLAQTMYRFGLIADPRHARSAPGSVP